MNHAPACVTTEVCWIFVSASTLPSDGQRRCGHELSGNRVSAETREVFRANPHRNASCSRFRLPRARAGTCQPTGDAERNEIGPTEATSDGPNQFPQVRGKGFSHFARQEERWAHS